RSWRRRWWWFLSRLCCRLCFWRRRSSSGYFGKNRCDVFVCVANHGDELAQRRRLAFADKNLPQDAIRKRLHFHRGFIGVDLREWLAHGDLVSLFLQPSRDLSLLH